MTIIYIILYIYQSLSVILSFNIQIPLTLQTYLPIHQEKKIDTPMQELLPEDGMYHYQDRQSTQPTN